MENNKKVEGQEIERKDYEVDTVLLIRDSKEINTEGFILN